MENIISADEMLFKMLENGNDNFIVNHNLILMYGLELAFFLAILIERQKKSIENKSISENKYFGLTDIEMALYSGIKYNRVEKIKKLGKKENLFLVREDRFTKESYYKLNEEKINEIISKKNKE